MAEEALQTNTGRLTVEQVKADVQLVQQVMREIMKEGINNDYGVIPGCKKPSLLKPGAEKLCTTFRLAPTYHIRRADLPRDHREYELVCTLTHIPTGDVYGQGVGCCSTKESKYRYREEKRKCPSCRSETIFKSKEAGKGWYCWAKKGGCGKQFGANDQAIASQTIGRAENEDLADQYNTVLKMGKKRSLVDAVLTVTAASDIFTQDAEDTSGNGEKGAEPQKKAEAKKEPAKKTEQPKTSNGKEATVEKKVEHIKKMIKDDYRKTFMDLPIQNFLDREFGTKMLDDLAEQELNMLFATMKDDDKGTLFDDPTGEPEQANP